MDEQLSPRTLAALQDAVIATDLSSHDWKRLGLLLDEADLISEHPRLLRSLYFGDDDYPDAVLDVLSGLLGDHEAAAIVDAAGLDDWLAANRPDAHAAIHARVSPRLRTAELSDDELVDADVIREHLQRMVDLADRDPAIAIGAAKELVESTTKLVLRELGEHYSGRADVPELVRLAGRALAVDARRVVQLV